MHDIDYISKDLQDRHVADVKMIHQIYNIPNPNFREKLERYIVKSIMKEKILIGQGLERHAENVANVGITHNQLRANKAQLTKSTENLLTGNRTMVNQKSAGPDDKAHDWRATPPDESERRTNAIG